MAHNTLVTDQELLWGLFFFTLSGMIFFTLTFDLEGCYWGSHVINVKVVPFGEFYNFCIGHYGASHIMKVPWKNLRDWS